MRTLFVVAILLIHTMSYSQQFTTTGGCVYDGLMTITDTDSVTINKALVNGNSYIAYVDLGDDIAECYGDINITLGSLVIGTVLHVYTGAFKIPLDTFNLPPGTYFLNYNFFITDLQSNFILVSDTVTVTGTTGITQLKEETGISIYPMPVTSELHIDVSKSKDNIDKVCLMDMSGRNLKTIQPDKGHVLLTIPVNDLAAGMYLLQLQTATGVLNEKIVVMH